MARSFNTQAQIQGFELTHPNIYTSHELQEYGKGPFLQIQSYRIFMTWDSNRISERSPGEDPVLILQQKRETLNQTNDSLQ